MSFETSLKGLLGGDSSIAALVAERTHPLILPENASKPSIVYTIVALQPETDLDCGDGSLLQVRVQIDVFSKQHGEMSDLAELIRLRMQAATVTANNFRIGDCFRQDGYEPDTKLYRATLDFTCWYRTA